MKQYSFGPLNIASLEALNAFAGVLAVALETGDVLALSGPVGVGKTSFVKAMVSRLNPGVTVNSPSFSLVNQYEGEHVIYHMDWYRLENKTSLTFLDLDYYFSNKKAITLIEWADRFPDCMPNNALKIELAFSGHENARKLTLSGSATQIESLKPLLGM